jgi:hypothetical protein
MTVATRLARSGLRHALHVCALGLFVAFQGPARGQDRDPFYEDLTTNDQAIADSRLQETLDRRRSMDAAQWRNPASGASGSFMPLRTFRIKTGFFCRDYREMLLAVGTLIERTGTACRAGNGVWIRVER